MMSSTLLLALQAGLLALASPVVPAAAAAALPEPVLLSARRTAGVYNASLPNITVLATGGTIAGVAATSDQVTGYKPGALGVDELLARVPALWNVSNPRGVQFANVGSQQVTSEILLNLTRAVQRELDDPRCGGVVVTHGTDTLEETAFFLDLAVRTDGAKPLVVVGSMRPASAISSDGPINLLEAVSVAASPAARNRGTLVVLNDRILSAYYGTKTQANAPDTFKAYEQGFLGHLLNVKPVFYFTPALPTGRPAFDVANATALPPVEVLYGYGGQDAELATAAVAHGARGLVLAGSGAGSWPDDGRAAVEKLVRRNGTAVVYSHRTLDGYVEAVRDGPGYGGGALNPQKARLMLQLALHAGYDEPAMRELFEFAG